MELRQLKYFLAVAEMKSFVHAAAKLYISRQAISKAVAQLEQELGTELFARDSSGAFLTSTGRVFYERIKNSVRELDGVRTEMQNFGTCYTQRIRLAVSVGLLSIYEAELLRFRQERDNLELDYQEYPENVCLEMLRDHKVDLVICSGDQEAADLLVQPLDYSPYGVLLKTTEELTALDSVDIQDLNWLPLAGLRDRGIMDLCQRYNLHLQFEGLDLYRLIKLTQSGKCALLLPKSLVPDNGSDLLWIPLFCKENWSVRFVCLRSMKNNMLYHTMMDELRNQIFHGNY